MNDIEQSASNSTPIMHTPYPKAESPGPSLHSYSQWQAQTHAASTSTLANSTASSSNYGSSFASSLMAPNDVYHQTPQESGMRASVAPPHPIAQSYPFQLHQARTSSTTLFSPAQLSSMMVSQAGLVRAPTSTPALANPLSTVANSKADTLLTANQNILHNATISRPPSIVHTSPVHKQPPPGQHSSTTQERTGSSMDTVSLSSSTPPVLSSGATALADHFYPTQIHGGAVASAMTPTTSTSSSATRTRSTSYSGPYFYPHLAFTNYSTGNPSVSSGGAYTPHPLAQQPMTLPSPGADFSTTTAAQTSNYAEPDGSVETGVKAGLSPLGSGAVGYYNADLPNSATSSPMPTPSSGPAKASSGLRLAIPMSAVNKSMNGASSSQFVSTAQSYRHQDPYGSHANGETYMVQQPERDGALPPPIPPLASSIATGGVSTLPRSMSTGSIHGNTISVFASHGNHHPLHRQTNGGHPMFSSTISSFSPMTAHYGSTSSSSGSLGSPSPPASYTTNPAQNAPRSSSRLAGPPLTIPSGASFSTETNAVGPASASSLQPNSYFTSQDYGYALTAGGHGGVSPTTITPTAAPNGGSNGGVMSSMMAMRAGTASNGGSVPITPITGPPMGMSSMSLGLGMNALDGDETLDYYSRLGDGLDSGMTGEEDMIMDGQAHSLQQQALQRAQQMEYGCNDENTEEATARMMMLGVMTPTHANSSGNVSPRRISSGLSMTPTTTTGPGFGSMGSTGNSPMGGPTRNERKRRSTTYTAGPSAAVGASRSRSGTLVTGGSAQLGNPSSASALGISSASLLPPTLSSMQQSPSQLTTDSHLSYAHSQQTYTTPHPLSGPLHGLSPMSTMQLQSSMSSAPLSSLSSSAVGGSLSVNPNLPNNSPLAMKELSPTIKPIIEDYLLRYLNHLCMNPNAKDRMGHQIHQMYTARRIQRYEQLYGWRPLKFRIEAFVNGFVDLLTARGMSQDVTMKIPHYLNNSKLFSRFNESGNRMKSQGQTIWRVRARCKTDIPGLDATIGAGQNAVANLAGHPPSAFSQPSMHHQVGMSPQPIQQQQIEDGLMMAPDPLLWEFLPYERCIVGQPPLAIVGTAWQWNMKVHDHWTPRKKVSWNFVASPVTSASGASSSPLNSNTVSPTSPTGSSSSILIPKWLSLQGSKLKGTPTQPGMYPITVEATFQDDNDPEPVVVRGHFTIQVSKAIGGWKAKMPVPEGLVGSPREGMEDIDGDEDSPEDQGSGGMMLGGTGPGAGNGMQAVSFSSLLGARTYEGMYGGHLLANQQSSLQYMTTPNGGGHVGYYAYVR